MSNAKAKEFWEKAWSAETHTTDYAAKRIISAKSAKLTPIKVDTTDMYGYFQGSHGRYETFLDSCPCCDFCRSKLPCKHIYRLAIKLGVLEETATTDTAAIPTPYKDRVLLTETIDIVEGLSENTQKVLLQIAGNTNQNLRFQFKYHGIDELIRSGLVIETKPDDRQIIWPRKSEITQLLDQEGVAYDPKAKKDALQQICWENLSEKAKELFDSWIFVDVSPYYSKRKIHYYLHRKFDYELYFEPENGETKKIPLLQTILPVDDVTNQLIQRGYYSRK